jgi:hypothetical protein
MSQKIDLTINLKPAKKQSDLKKGDTFLWRSGQTGKFEIHTFHSCAGYGAKTFTDYNEETGSSMLVNYSGICGIIESVNQ